MPDEPASEDDRIKFWTVVSTLLLLSVCVALLGYLISNGSYIVGGIGALGGLTAVIAWFFPTARRDPVRFLVAVLIVLVVDTVALRVVGPALDPLVHPAGPIDVTSQIQTSGGQSVHIGDVVHMKLEGSSSRRSLAIAFSVTDADQVTQNCVPGTSLQVAVDVNGNVRPEVTGQPNNVFSIDLGASTSTFDLDVRLVGPDPACVMNLAVAHADLRD